MFDFISDVWDGVTGFFEDIGDEVSGLFDFGEDLFPEGMATDADLNIVKSGLSAGASVLKPLVAAGVKTFSGGNRPGPTRPFPVNFGGGQMPITSRSNAQGPGPIRSVDPRSIHDYWTRQMAQFSGLQRSVSGSRLSRRDDD